MKKRIYKGLGIALAAVFAFGVVACSSEEGHNHSFSADWTKTETTHWHAATCEHTDQKKDQGPHSWSYPGYQYDSASGKEINTCSVCGYVAQKDHIHFSTTKWTITATTHKEVYECCGIVKTEEAAHSENSGEVTTEPTCVTKGVKTYKCSVCGKNERNVDIPELYSSAIDVTTGKAATSASTYVYFGVFPKTVKASSITVDDTKTASMGPNTYYKGSDGEYYAKVTANPYEDSYTYSDGSIVDKTVTYFKVEPIKWKVLTKNYNGTEKALLLAENILTANVPYYSGSDHTIGTNTVYVNNYKYSTIHAYLNGKYESGDTQSSGYSNAGFLQTAFTTSAQALIVDTTIVNDGASTSDATGALPKADGTVIESGSVEGGDAVYYPDFTCANTINKIFLLSEKEVTTTDYGFAASKSSGTGSGRIRVTTDYAKANKAFQGGDSDEGGYWWLRSPCYKDSQRACYIGKTGKDNWNTNAFVSDIGVVPALTIGLGE